MPLLLTCAAALAVLGSWGIYLASVPSGRVPARPLGHLLVQSAGMALAVAGLWATRDAGGIARVGSLAAGSIALVMGALFVFLLSQRRTPIGRLTVAVGDTLPPLAAVDDRGRPWTSASLDGERILLKFFRGHW